MPRQGSRPLYRNIPSDQAELIALLADRYAPRSIRFDSGFVGSVPVQCYGRIGRRYFYFRFRGDSASLTIGSADHRRDASHAKHARRRALRQLRRGDDDGFGGFMAQSELKRDKGLDRHPSRAVWYAAMHDVTGERYAGSLDAEESAELFVQLMDQLRLVGPEPRFRMFKFGRRGPYTAPSGWTQGIIRKPSKTRR